MEGAQPAPLAVVQPGPSPPSAAPAPAAPAPRRPGRPKSVKRCQARGRGGGTQGERASRLVLLQPAGGSARWTGGCRTRGACSQQDFRGGCRVGVGPANGRRWAGAVGRGPSGRAACALPAALAGTATGATCCRTHHQPFWLAWRAEQPCSPPPLSSLPPQVCALDLAAAGLKGYYCRRGVPASAQAWVGVGACDVVPAGGAPGRARM